MNFIRACSTEQDCVGLIFQRGFFRRHIFTPGVRNKKATFLIWTTSLLLAANHNRIANMVLSASLSLVLKFIFISLFYILFLMVTFHRFVVIRVSFECFYWLVRSFVYLEHISYRGLELRLINVLWLFLVTFDHFWRN